MLLDVLLSPWTLLALALAVIVLPILHAHNRHQALNDVPGPILARFSTLWYMYECRRCRRYETVHALHTRLGRLVRLQPNHVSIADPDAIPIVYGHGTGTLKAPYYDAFVSIQRGLFNTRDRAEHTRKRKLVSHTFSAKSVGQFEQYIHADLLLFTKKWDALSEDAAASQVPASDSGPGYAVFDALHWFNYVAFDIIGDLAFGAPFGMLERGQDMAEVRLTPEAPAIYAPAIQVLNRRGEVSNTVGCWPSIKPYAKYLPDPFFSKGMQAIQLLAGIATARVNARLADISDLSQTDGPTKSATSRVDLLARLMEGKDDAGNPLGRAELTAEALTQLIAGSDTTSNTSCALLFHCLRTPHVVLKLQAELDTAIPRASPSSGDHDIDPVPTYAQVRDLPYLDMVINETLRIHSTSSQGLPRLVPEDGGGLWVAGRLWPPGTVLSVPAYTMHHSKEIWGEDADAFRPERWANVTEKQKLAFIPFSYGPRACVGRNVAEMELALIVATVFRNYEFELHQSELKTREGFLRKPLGLKVGMRRRKSPQ